MQIRVRRIKTFKKDWRGRRRLVETHNILECRDECKNDGWNTQWEPLPIVDEELEVDDW